jgi:hypothetical protein
MGGFYGSIHVRSENKEAVRAALEEVSRDLGTKFLLAPLIDGWISAFPEDNGQNPRTSAALAERTDNARGGARTWPSWTKRWRRCGRCSEEP